MRPAALDGQGIWGRRRLSDTGWRRSPPLWEHSSRGRGIVGNCRVQLWGRWRERQGWGRLDSAGLRGGQFLQRAPKALIHLIQVDVIQVSSGQVEATREALHLGLRGRGARWGELKATAI